MSALNSLLEFLLDKLIIMGISLAAGAITAETGVGALVGGLFALSQAFEAEAKWKDILKAIDSGWALVNGFIGTSVSACADLTGLTSQMAPGGTYEHPEA
ncbi:hypothetical protein [Segniliparus rotundus]|uniref:hypothetical protein n=1 Tax=Segniliparus rotundus TaxID=286802 RepID=UPI0002DEDDF7|nr:hypothetical protein [Segniliparus rotundus]